MATAARGRLTGLVRGIEGRGCLAGIFLLPDTSLEAAEAVARRLKHAIDPVLSVIHPSSGVSYGVAVVARGEGASTLYAAADSELYKAKEARPDLPETEG